MKLTLLGIALVAIGIFNIWTMVGGNNPWYGYLLFILLIVIGAVILLLKALPAFKSGGRVPRKSKIKISPAMRQIMYEDEVKNIFRNINKKE